MTSGGRLRVWDPVVRLTHALYGVLVVAAIVTSERDETGWLHLRFGVALLAVLVLRIVWGLVGSRYARFAQFVRGPHAVLDAARAMLRGQPQRTLGHNPVGGVMVVVLLLVMAGTALTGVLVSLGGEPVAAGFVGRLHAASALVLPALILVHVAGVLFSSAQEGQNLVLGMVTGWKHALAGVAVEPEPPRRARLVGPVVAIAVSFSVALVTWQRLPEGAKAPRGRQSPAASSASE